jgi:hypothetical protein
VGLSCFATFLNSDSLAERYPGPFGLLLGHVEDDLSTGRGLEVTESAVLQHFFASSQLSQSPFQVVKTHSFAGHCDLGDIPDAASTTLAEFAEALHRILRLYFFAFPISVLQRACQRRVIFAVPKRSLARRVR